jgi:hypothetical protein
LQGRRISALTDRLDSRVELNVNDIRTATVTVSLEDEVVPIVQAMDTRLKVWLDESIILNAPVFLPHHENAGAGSLAISATDNLRLAAKFCRGANVQTGVDQSEIMAWLIEHADATAAEKLTGIPGHGIIRGDLGVGITSPPTGLIAANGGAGSLVNIYFFVVTAVVGGVESPGSSEVLGGLGGGPHWSAVALNWQPVAGATKYYVYFGTTSGGENLRFDVGTSTSALVNTTAGAASATPPAAAATQARDRTYYDGQNIWDALQEFPGLIDGVDFELEPLDREDGIYAQLNTFYPRQGSDRSDSVVMEFGCGRHNASAYTFDPSGEQLVNRYIIAGQTPDASPTTPAWISEQIESQKLYGPLEGFEVDTDIIDNATLQAHADAVVRTRAFPIDFFSIAPAVEGDTEQYGTPPQFGPDADYWLGDTIGTIIKDGALEVGLRGRVSGAVITEADQAGNVAVEISCTPPDKAAAVTGFSTNLTLGPMDQSTDSGSVDTSEPPDDGGGAAPKLGKWSAEHFRGKVGKPAHDAWVQSQKPKKGRK